MEVEDDTDDDPNNDNINDKNDEAIAEHNGNNQAGIKAKGEGGEGLGDSSRRWNEEVSDHGNNGANEDEPDDKDTNNDYHILQ